MKKARKVIAAALVGFLAMGMLAGCGGGKKDEGPVTLKLATTVNEQVRRTAELPSTFIEPAVTRPSICSRGNSSKDRAIILA